MPAYATSMRLKFPIVALALEVITIILFAVFVVYDDGKGHGHDGHGNDTGHQDPPMMLYPSKCKWCGWFAKTKEGENRNYGEWCVGGGGVMRLSAGL